MVAWALKEFGGEIPKVDSRMLPDFAAEQAVNCDLESGALDGLPQPELIIDLSATPNTMRAYRFPVDGTTDVWLPLADPDSSVCRSPLANDTAHRVYWTNPPSSAVPGAFWNTRDRIAAGSPPYDLGTIQPDATFAPTVVAAGGTPSTTLPYIGRSYCWTYVNQYGEESAPSAPSTTVQGASDGTWTITGLPLTAPANPVGKNFPTVTGAYLYRTSTGSTSGAQFYRVATWDFISNPPPVSYSDTLADTVAVNNTILASASWANPPGGLDGLTALPGGMLVGFSGNTMHFCEPDRPHTWPVAYDQSVQYAVMGLGVWQQSLVVLTRGFPSTGSGNSPSNYVFTQVKVPEPCIARGSIITDLMGVYYASQNGLVMLNYYGMQNQSLSMLTKNIWLTEFAAADIVACRHRAQYLAMRKDGSGTGFLIDYSNPKLGMMPVSTLANVTSIWNDEYSGDAYICAGGKVYRWDSPATDSMIYRWRSKQYFAPAPLNIAAVQISLDPAVEQTQPADLLPSTDPTLTLPTNVNAVFRLYAGQNAEMLMLERSLTKQREIFPCPSGLKTFTWQCEIVARVPVKTIELATTMTELRGV